MSVVRPKILDCTLRDGGYYNEWGFSLEFSKQMVAALVEAGVDVIEMGYRSLPQKGFCGPFKYTPESALQYLRQYPEVDFAFMIDVKEYVTEGKLNEQLLDSAIKDRKDSVFAMARLASYYATLEPAIQAIDYFTRKGYKVCFNLMGSAMLTKEQMVNALQLAEGKPLEAFYIADSFGSMYPQQVKELIKFFRSNYSGPIGLHLHENQGMAYANAIAALEEGVEYMDATITGMGRGAGNLIMEQFLQGYAQSSGDAKIKPHALLDFIAEYMAPLKAQYQWGYNYVYMLSGLKNIHPTYCQALLDGNRYTFAQISEILNAIPAANKGKYTEESLNAAIKLVLSSNNTVAANETALPQFSTTKAEKILIVAGGKSAAEHIDGIKLFIEQHKPTIYECNNTGLLAYAKNRTTIILNAVKLQHYIHITEGKHNTIVTGQKMVEGIAATENVYTNPYTLGNYKADRVQIPDYDAGMYTIALAQAAGAQQIYLAGFDGFADAEKNNEMQQFFDAFAAATGKKLIAVTPTLYNSAGLKKESVYSLLS